MSFFRKTKREPEATEVLSALADTKPRHHYVYYQAKTLEELTALLAKLNPPPRFKNSSEWQLTPLDDAEREKLEHVVTGNTTVTVKMKGWKVQGFSVQVRLTDSQYQTYLATANNETVKAAVLVNSYVVNQTRHGF